MWDILSKKIDELIKYNKIKYDNKYFFKSYSIYTKNTILYYQCKIEYCFNDIQYIKYYEINV
jgi:hypothetical protein